MKEIFEKLKSHKTKLAVVGLGYVGLPLAHAFSEKYEVVGFDINQDKIDLLKRGIDPTGEISDSNLKNCRIDFSTDPNKLKDCKFIVVAVPTAVVRENWSSL